jgi:hypothetical protein
MVNVDFVRSVRVHPCNVFVGQDVNAHKHPLSTTFFWQMSISRCRTGPIIRCQCTRFGQIQSLGYLVRLVSTIWSAIENSVELSRAISIFGARDCLSRHRCRWALFAFVQCATGNGPRGTCFTHIRNAERHDKAPKFAG